MLLIKVTNILLFSLKALLWVKGMMFNAAVILLLWSHLHSRFPCVCVTAKTGLGQSIWN